MKNTKIYVALLALMLSLTACGSTEGKSKNAGAEDIRSPQETAYEQMKENIMEELKKTFRPEFLNRVDEIIVFRSLTQPQLEAIARQLLSMAAQRLEAKGISLSVTDEAVSAIAKEGYDPDYGARPLRRVIRERLENPAAQLILRGKCKDGDSLKLFLKNGELFLESVVKAICESSQNNDELGE